MAPTAHARLCQAHRHSSANAEMVVNFVMIAAVRTEECSSRSWTIVRCHQRLGAWTTAWQSGFPGAIGSIGCFTASSRGRAEHHDKTIRGRGEECRP
jgi:hypothetical protein